MEPVKEFQLRPEEEEPSSALNSFKVIVHTSGNKLKQLSEREEAKSFHLSGSEQSDTWKIQSQGKRINFKHNKANSLESSKG